MNNQQEVYFTHPILPSFNKLIQGVTYQDYINDLKMSHFAKMNDNNTNMQLPIKNNDASNEDNDNNNDNDTIEILQKMEEKTLTKKRKFAQCYQNGEKKQQKTPNKRHTTELRKKRYTVLDSDGKGYVQISDKREVRKRTRKQEEGTEKKNQDLEFKFTNINFF